ncbi:MAG: helix-turn-helix domain-containing protein [Flavobacteriales bacterium]|nr:helix-turn-helix domain-containing protein [Flavobacteriales bacterium]
MKSFKEEHIKLIFGLKVKQLRSRKKLSLQDLSKLSGLSISYLNEIEKGKKYPKTDKIIQISGALGVSYEKLISTKLDRELAPIAQILDSEIFKELPLDLFGLDLTRLVEIISNAPLKVNAFISTIIELARNYDLGQNEFYYAALRSLQESTENYFQDLENYAYECRKQYNFLKTKKVNSEYLISILEDSYAYEVKSLQNKSVFRPIRYLYKKKEQGHEIFLNPELTESQKCFVLSKELGYQFMNIEDRPNIAPILSATSFEMVFNNFKSSYFASSLLIDQKLLVGDLKKIVVNKKWNSREFLKIMQNFTDSPEMFMHRLTNILPKYFGIKSLFFLRFENKHKTNYYRLTKELHLSKLHNPHGNGLEEHYCRRWISIKVLKEMEQLRSKNDQVNPILRTQISNYHDSDNEYFLIAIARAKNRIPNTNSSIGIGFQVTSELKKKLRFWNDPSIPKITVNETCERCPIEDCKERAQKPTILIQQEKLNTLKTEIEKIIS